MIAFPRSDSPPRALRQRRKTANLILGLLQLVAFWSAPCPAVLTRAKAAILQQTTGLKPLYRKRIALSVWRKVRILYRKETKWRVDTSVLSLRHTNQAIWTAVWFVFNDTGA